MKAFSISANPSALTWLMRIKSKFLWAKMVLVIALFIHSETYAATTRYVTPATIVAEISNSDSGDVIKLKKGIYTTSLTISKPITLVAEEVGSVIFQGNITITIRESDVTIDGLIFNGTTSTNAIYVQGPCTGTLSNFRITNCAFISCGVQSLTQTNGGNIRIDDTPMKDCGGSSTPGTGKVHGGQIDHCFFYDSRVCGIKYGYRYPDNIVIEYNVFKHFISTNGGTVKQNGNEPIALGSGGTRTKISNTIVQHNYFEDVNTTQNGEPEIISVKTKGNIIRNNTIRNSSAYGYITLRDADSAQIYNNFLFGAGIRLYGDNHTIYNNYIDGTGVNCTFTGITSKDAGVGDYNPVKNCTVAFNTIVNTTLGINLGVPTKTTAVTGNTFTGNLLFSNKANTALTNITTITGNTWSKNLAWVTGSAAYDGYTRTTDPADQCSPLASVTVLSSGVTSNPTAFTQANPNLVQSNGMYKLSSSNPPAGNQVPKLTGIDIDMDGHTRPSQTDIGADEFSTATISSKPYSATDIGKTVGPTWLYKYGLEAELGLSNPTVFVVGTDGSPSAGQYIWWPSGSRNDTQVEDASYIFYTSPLTTQYNVWVRRIYPNSGSDSFHIKYDNSPWTTTPNSGTVASWTWADLGTQTFSPGSHTLSVGHRESGAKLDRILITSDLMYNPSGPGGRVTTLTNEGLESFTLFPNPTRSFVDMKLYAESEQQMTFSLLNVQAQLVSSGGQALEEGVNTVRIPLRDLNRGLYIMRVNLNGQVLSRKLLID